MLKQSNVIIIAICGGSGSGKTTAANQICDLFGASRCQIIRQDDYYHDQSHLLKGAGSVNYDEPASIDFALLASHLNSLKQGHSVSIPQYDLVTHKRKLETVLVPSVPVVIVDGILLLASEEVRPFFDHALFLKVREEVRFARRLKRDVEKRGRTEAEVREQFFTFVKPMHDKFVEPSQEFATHVLSGESHLGSILKQFVESIQARGEDFETK